MKYLIATTLEGVRQRKGNHNNQEEKGKVYVGVRRVRRKQHHTLIKCENQSTSTFVVVDRGRRRRRRNKKT